VKSHHIRLHILKEKEFLVKVFCWGLIEGVYVPERSLHVRKLFVDEGLVMFSSLLLRRKEVNHRKTPIWASVDRLVLCGVLCGVDDHRSLRSKVQ
jgi:hypothetical protein